MAEFFAEANFVGDPFETLQRWAVGEVGLVKGEDRGGTGAGFVARDGGEIGGFGVDDGGARRPRLCAFGCDGG